MRPQERTRWDLVSVACAVVALIIVRPTLATAQQEAARDSVLAGFSADLADLQRLVGAVSAEMRLGFTGAEVEYGNTLPMLAPDSAKVVVPATSLREAPTVDAQPVRTLDEGTHGRLLDIRGDWYEVLTASGSDGEASGWIPASNAQLVFPSRYSAGMAGFAGLWESVIEKARDLRDKYVNNPYVEVTGFDVQLGITGLSLTVGFEFK